MWKKFLSTLRTYTFRERLASILFLVLFLYSTVHFVTLRLRFANTYTEGLVGYVTSLNPLFSDLNEADREVGKLLFSGLTKYDPVKRAVVEDMATLKLDSTQTQYTFTLRDFLKWHDGEPVTADDVYFTFHTIIQSPDFSNPLLKANFDGVEVEKIDAKTVRFSLKKPNSFFITNFTVGLLPKHIFAGIPVADLATSDLNAKAIGTGPYMLADEYRLGLDQKGEIRLKRFDDYYGGISQIRYFVFQTYPTIQALVDEIDTLDGAAHLAGDDMNLISKTGNFKLFPYELPNYSAVFMNFESAILQQKPVRLALQKALDKKKLLDILPGRMGVDTPLLELNQEDWVYQSSVEQANGALYDAGWRFPEGTAAGAKKVRKSKKGNPLKLTLVARQFPEGSRKLRETQQTLNFLKESWTALGAEINVQLYPLDEFKNVVSERNYDLLLAGQSLGYNFDTYYFWHSTQASSGQETSGGLNLSNYRSFAVDALIEDIRRTFDDTKKQSALNKLAKTMKDDIPAIFLFRDIYFYASNKTVSQLSLNHLAFPSDRFANIVDWVKE
jgi:peptide/nickel transport system substrate-binding protein